jgi:hypothetical protein
MTTTLATATLQRLKRVGKPAKNKPARVEPDGEPLPVQFNPSSLKIARSNNVDRGGVTAKTQKVQNPSAEPSKLTFDLEFDTAEQTWDGRSVDVREWTALVRQFVEPPTDPQNAGKPPPAVQFAWGTLVFNGIVEQMNEDLDYFAPDGTPVHAKVSVSISEQNFAYEALAGAAARDDKAATEPGGRPPSNAPGQTPPGSAPGSKGTRDAKKVVEAIDGESAQQLLSRLGLDPEAWRAAMNDLDSPLDLAAGTPVLLGAEVEDGAGLGDATQFAAALSTTDPTGLAEALGMVGGADAGRERSGTGSGFLLAAWGGVQAATDRVQGARASAATATSRGSFAIEAGGLPRPEVAPELSRRPPRPDVRSLTFGWGIPLQSRGSATTVAAAAAGGQSALSARARRVDLPSAGGSTPPWENPAPSPPPSPRQRAGDGRGRTLRRVRGGECS